MVYTHIEANYTAPQRDIKEALITVKETLITQLAQND